MSEVKRDERGRVVSGALNPGGRPKADHSVTDLAREHTPEAMEKIVDLMRNGETQKDDMDFRLRRRSEALGQMGVDVPAQERRLKEQQARAPDRR